MRDENKRTAHLCAARDPSNLVKCLFPVGMLPHLALFWCIPDGGSQQMVGNARAVKRRVRIRARVGVRDAPDDGTRAHGDASVEEGLVELDDREGE